jgi:hypothetical protein
MIKYGGRLAEIVGDVIGEGTHGKIYKIKNKSNVLKVYKNINTKCKEIEVNEYLIHKTIYEESINEDLKIKIPQIYNFNKEEDYCYYEMDEIHKINNEIIIIDMYYKNIERKFSHSNYGKLKGYNKILYNNDITNKYNLAYEIGKMFSFLHFKLLIDGYDCELLLGNNNKNENTFYLIDFDKVSRIESFDTFNYTINRKIDESTTEIKNINNPKKLARILFTAMISMSLIPTEEDMKAKFIEGYNFYVNEPQKPTFELVVEEINNYKNDL